MVSRPPVETRVDRLVVVYPNAHKGEKASCRKIKENSTYNKFYGYINVKPQRKGRAYVEGLIFLANFRSTYRSKYI